MSNFTDLQKTIDFMEYLDQEKVHIGVSTCWASEHWGKMTKLQKYWLFALTPSSAPRNLSNDEIYQRTRSLVFESAKLSCDKARNQIYERLKLIFPEHHLVVFVWKAGSCSHTKFKRTIAHAQFLVKEDKGFGNDVLILLY